MIEDSITAVKRFVLQALLSTILQSLSIKSALKIAPGFFQRIGTTIKLFATVMYLFITVNYLLLQ
jgi:hypothetical protein